MPPVIGAGLVEDDDGDLIEFVQAGRPGQGHTQLAVIADSAFPHDAGDLELRCQLGVPATLFPDAVTWRPPGAAALHASVGVTVVSLNR